MGLWPLKSGGGSTKRSVKIGVKSFFQKVKRVSFFGVEVMAFDCHRDTFQ